MKMYVSLVAVSLSSVHCTLYLYWYCHCTMPLHTWYTYTMYVSLYALVHVCVFELDHAHMNVVESDDDSATRIIVIVIVMLLEVKIHQTRLLRTLVFAVYKLASAESC
jgi:hypothetical protein